MLKDCLEVFNKKYLEYGDSLILDSYVLSAGTYILVNNDGSIDDDFKLEVVKKDINNISNTRQYEYFSKLDYLSKIINTNKGIDGKKIIHSNNYLSFFVKKDNIIPDNKGNTKLTESIIDNYYEILKNPSLKYKSEKKWLAMYEKCESKYGKVNLDKLNENKEWIKNNIYTILDRENIKKDKNYLKIFFKFYENENTLDVYENESKKYIIPNIYNKPKYNIEIDGKIYGLPNDNISLDEVNKPYLKSRGRKISTPYLIDEEEALNQKRFFDYLYNHASANKRLVYINFDSIKPDIEFFSDYETNKFENFKGYFLRIQTGKKIKVEIHDFDSIVDWNESVDDLVIEKVIERKDNPKYKEKIKYDSAITRMNELENYINEVFFNKLLKNRYFKAAKEIGINDPILKRIIISYRESIFNCFRKGQVESFKSTFPSYSLELIKNTLIKGYTSKAVEQFDLRNALINYFNGGNDTMADFLTETRDLLREKINSKTTEKIESDQEYYIAAGQMASFLISRSKAGTQKHSLARPIINCKNNKKLREELRKLYKKYDYDIAKNSLRFNNLFAMLLGYKTEDEIVNEEYLLAGYMSSNIIYETKEEN